MKTVAVAIVIAALVVLAAVLAAAVAADSRLAKLEKRVEVAEARADSAFLAVGQCVTNEQLRREIVSTAHVLVSHNRRIRAFERAYPLGTR